MAADAFGNAAGRMSQGMSSYGTTSGYFNDEGDKNKFMKDKLSGK